MSRQVVTLAAAASVLVLQFLLGCAPGTKATDPVSVTRDFFDAINRGQAETAASFFESDGEFTWSFGQPKGIQKIQDYFKTNLIPLKTHVEIISATANGMDLTGTFKITSTWLKNAFPSGVPLFKMNGVIQNGKIKSMLWTTPK